MATRRYYADNAFAIAMVRGKMFRTDGNWGRESASRAERPLIHLYFRTRFNAVEITFWICQKLI